MTMSSYILSLLLTVLNISYVFSTQDLDCTGKIKIFDGVNKKFYLITENDTNIAENIEINSQSYVDMSGDCCFTLYSDPEAGGYQQSLESEGEYKLEIRSIQSVYVTECYRPWWKHPVFLFFVFSLITIIILYCGYNKGKELLCRRRV